MLIAQIWNVQHCSQLVTYGTENVRVFVNFFHQGDVLAKFQPHTIHLVSRLAKPWLQMMRLPTVPNETMDWFNGRESR